MKQHKSRGKKKEKRYLTSFFNAWIHVYNVKIHEIFHANSLSPSCNNVALPYFYQGVFQKYQNFKKVTRDAYFIAGTAPSTPPPPRF